jgi:hypothetical protein
MVVISAGASTPRTLLLAHLVSRKRDIKAVLYNEWGVTLAQIIRTGEDHQKLLKIEHGPIFLV